MEFYSVRWRAENMPSTAAGKHRGCIRDLQDDAGVLGDRE